ncbi:MAG: ABC transporter ATP-binding protein [Oscillospiraceae bacterium]|jgi:iron complex transport system ATP-binding protein|nr:ABC transporter ATP-binding protein [Oscillospiraceae bacterium]
MLEVRELTGGYHKKEVLHGLSLRLEDGKITAILGPNGCGKSTLLKLAASHLKPFAGDILVDGQPMETLRREALARHVAYLPQSRAVPDITVGALALHGRFPWLGYPRVYRAEDRAIAEQAMQRAGILHKQNELLAALSGGERQKAYLALLLAQNAQTVLLDEPTTYLDPARQLELAELLRLLRSEGRAVAVVMHDLHLAFACADTLAVLHEGRLAATGAPAQVRASGVLEAVFGVPVGE